jgi:hypothetical protein
MLTTSKQAVNQRTRMEIDLLLESGVDIDQVALLESESFTDSKQGNEKCNQILRKMEGHVIENAKKIQEARKLILTIS